MSIKQFSKLNYLTKNYNTGNVVGEGSSYAVTGNTATVSEGNVVVYTITTTGIPDGTTYYWTTSGTSNLNDFSPAAASGSVVISNNSATVSRTLSNDLSTEGTETIVFQLRRDSIAGEIKATASSVDISDTSLTPTTIPYVIVPVGTTTGTSAVSAYKFVNLSTYSVDYTATASITGTTIKVFRFGDFILETRMDSTATYYVRNFKTNTVATNGTWSFTYSQLGYDFIKFASDRFGLLYKYQLRYYMDTYSFNTTTGAISSKIATIDYGALADESGAGGASLSNPHPNGAASINIDINGQVNGYNGYILFTGIWADGSPTSGTGYYNNTFNIVSVALDGTSGSLVSTTGFNNVNRSRTAANYGYNGAVYCDTFDNSAYRIMNSSGTYSTSGNRSGQYITPTSSGPASILGTSNWMTTSLSGSTLGLYQHTVTSPTLSTSVTIATGIGSYSGYILQMCPSGCILIYNDSSNAVKYIRYDGTSWTSPASISGLGSVTINYSSGGNGYHWFRCYNL